MIDKTAVLDAEKMLFNSILSRDILREHKYDIQQIIKVYTEDDEIKNIMQVFNLTATDFEIIYNHILESLEFNDLIFTAGEPCLFATALLLDLSSVTAIANKISFSSKTSKDRHKYLLESAIFSARAFFLEHAVKQNIASVQHFCRNGIYEKLRK